MDKGAHFHRCDFQVHSPRDPMWHGQRPSSDSERRDYATDFIAACRQKGIDAFAVTDHHDMAFVPYLRQAALDEAGSDGNPIPDERRITVFPGMELTLGIPCQAILIFDANFPTDMFSLVTNALAINPADASEPQCSPVTRLERITSFDLLHADLDKHEYLRGRYILLPNVSESGNSTLLRSGHAGHYKNMPCIGGYLDGTVEQLGQGNADILNGRNTQYGNKRLALFQTSDNRRRDSRDLGRATTWVKWAEATAEALRQACLARESRISYIGPLMPSIAITSLNVSNSSFMGPIFVELNNQYNAIIGGRGSGKSTLLEYMRWALCDEPSHSNDEELASHDAKRGSLVRQTLTALRANVQVDFVVNGVPHSVRRDSASSELTLRIGSGDYEPCTESDIRTLLPIQAYSQKQLSSVGVRLDELTRFVRTPIRQQLDDLALRCERIALDMRNAYASVQQERALRKHVDNDEREFRSLSARVQTMRDQLTGIGEQDQLVLSQYNLYAAEQEIISTWNADMKALDEALKNLKDLTRASRGRVVDYNTLPNAPLLRTMRDQMELFLGNLNAAIEGQLADLRSVSQLTSTTSSAQVELVARHDSFKKAYEAAKKKSTTHEITLKELGELEERLKLIRDRIVSSKSALASAGTPEEAFSKLRNAWYAEHEKRTDLIKEQCGNMTTFSDGQIRARIKEGASVGEIAFQLKKSFSGANIRSTKIDDLCSRIVDDEDPVLKYRLILDDLELLASYDVEDPASEKLPDTPTLASSGFTRADLERISRKLTPEAWIDLCLTALDDEPVFEYRTRQDEYIPFGDASAGQQATSLLTALLNQGGVPLIIDQPEDDLDNKVVLDIVARIWNAKQTRQLIFSSHNANLVVNGDAELVICCDYRVMGDQSGGQIKYQGAIDMQDVREEITSVMEGGHEAFKLRTQKYGF